MKSDKIKSEVTPGAFDEILLTPASHFRILFYEAVYRLLYYLQSLERNGGQPLEDLFEKYPFLGGYMAEIIGFMPDDILWQDGLAWWQDQLSGWVDDYAGHLPLQAVLQMPGVNRLSRTAFLLIGLVEEDGRFGTLFADIQAPLPQRRPCLGLIGQIISTGSDSIDHRVMIQPLVSYGLARVSDPDVPRSEWVFQVPNAVWDTTRGAAGGEVAIGPTTEDASSFPSIEDIVLPAEFQERLANVPATLMDGRARLLLVRGSEGSRRRTVLGAVARALDKDVHYIEEGAVEEVSPFIGALCAMRNTLPVFKFDVLPGETVALPALAGYKGPVGVLMGKDGGVKSDLAGKEITLHLPLLKSAERELLWNEAFDGYEVKELETITERFILPGDYIQHAATAAIAQATLAGRSEIAVEDVRSACRMLNRQKLDTLAALLETDASWTHLVVNQTVSQKLRELEQRCRYREKLLAYLGPAFGSQMNRGVRALFSGPSGTGKTLAAKILAAELGMDLYRVDLASVINKYIGETEKNLHQVFSTAEELDVILLLDEGDALLGSRTDVKSSNDRYANLETNYLLQRLEHYEGIVIVTTNLADNIDSAFQRRMDVVVQFVPPEAKERLQLWYLHLPEWQAVEADFLEQVAICCKLTGGQIRNATMLATLLALDGKNKTVNQSHLEQALRSEYRKAGATFSMEFPAANDASDKKMTVFLSRLT